jgi:hypothetical protein
MTEFSESQLKEERIRTKHWLTKYSDLQTQLKEEREELKRLYDLGDKNRGMLFGYIEHLTSNPK